MTKPEEDPNAFPAEWGYNPAPKGAVEAAFDVFASSMSDSEFDEFVARVRPTGRR
jgi:hypothetical protein